MRTIRDYAPPRQPERENAFFPRQERSPGSGIDDLSIVPEQCDAYETPAEFEVLRLRAKSEQRLARKNRPLRVATSSLRARKFLNRRFRVCLRA
jgi:hypothetical protein